MTEPRAMAMRVLPRLLYGPDHAYASPFTGSGTEAAVATMTPADMAKFHQTWFKPNNATLIVVGDTTLKEIVPQLEQRFAAWKAGDVPHKNIGPAPQPEKPAVYLIDRPGSIQSVVVAADLAPPTGGKHEVAIETMNSILGGTFTSRLNMNLREDKHWTYGARTMLYDARGPRPFIAYAPVQTDKTKEATAEMDKELNGILGKRSVTDDELNKAKKNETLTLPGRWETSRVVARSIAEMVQFDLPDNYFETYPGKGTVAEPGRSRTGR